MKAPLNAEYEKTQAPIKEAAAIRAAAQGSNSVVTLRDQVVKLTDLVATLIKD